MCPGRARGVSTPALSTSQASLEERWLNRHQILQENGFDPHKVGDADAAKLLADILEDNRKVFGHEYRELASESKNPLLTKYFYVVDKGVNRAHVLTECNRLAETAMVKQQDVERALTASSSSGVSIKIENMAWVRFKEEAEKLNSAKITLDKLGPQASDLYFQVKMSKNPDAQRKAQEMKEVKEKIAADAEKLREFAMEMKQVDASDDDLHGKIKTMESLCAVALVHSDGFKAIKRRLAVLMD